MGDTTQQARRARDLVHLGELSAARQALLSGPLAPGTPNTLAELRNPARRPPQPYDPIPPEVAEFQPEEPTDLPGELLVSNLRRARKGSAPGPTGFTSESLRLVLDDEEATNRFIAVAQQLGRGQIAPPVASLLGLGRLVAWQKPNGGIRGLVIGDVLRRLVARSLAQLYATHSGSLPLPIRSLYPSWHRSGHQSLGHFH